MKKGTVDPVAVFLRNPLLRDDCCFSETAYCSLIRFFPAGEQTDQGTLSSPVLPDDADPFPVIYRQGLNIKQFPISV